ncbi:unnamed protein product [Prunus armeniaca]
MAKQTQTCGLYLPSMREGIGLRPLRIPGNQAPFNKNEVHYSEAEFYIECTGAGSNPSKDFGTYLPSWTEICDLSNEELITIVDQERKKHSEVNNHAYDHPQCSKVTLPNIRIVPEYGGEGMQANNHKGPDNKASMPCAFQEPMTAPRHMQDGSMAVAEQLETIKLSDDPSAQKPISISIHLTSEEKGALASLLREFRDVFAWNYEECQA